MADELYDYFGGNASKKVEPIEDDDFDTEDEAPVEAAAASDNPPIAENTATDALAQSDVQSGGNDESESEPEKEKGGHWGFLASMLGISPKAAAKESKPKEKKARAESLAPAKKPIPAPVAKKKPRPNPVARTEAKPAAEKGKEFFGFDPIESPEKATVLPSMFSSKSSNDDPDDLIGWKSPAKNVEAKIEPEESVPSAPVEEQPPAASTQATESFDDIYDDDGDDLDGDEFVEFEIEELDESPHSDSQAVEHGRRTRRRKPTGNSNNDGQDEPAEERPRSRAPKGSHQQHDEIKAENRKEKPSESDEPREPSRGRGRGRDRGGRNRSDQGQVEREPAVSESSRSESSRTDSGRSDSGRSGRNRGGQDRDDSTRDEPKRGRGRGNRDRNQPQQDRPEPASAESRPSERPSGFGAGILEDEFDAVDAVDFDDDNVNDAGFSEPAASEDEKPKRKRRRRRGRSRGEGASNKKNDDLSSEEKPSGKRGSPGGGFGSGLTDEDHDEYDDSEYKDDVVEDLYEEPLDDDVEEEEESSRSQRPKRGRSRGRGRGRTSQSRETEDRPPRGHDDQDDDQEFDDNDDENDDDSVESDSGSRSNRSQRSRNDRDREANPMADRKRAKVPTWDETITVLIESNIQKPQEEWWWRTSPGWWKSKRCQQ